MSTLYRTVGMETTLPRSESRSAARTVPSIGTQSGPGIELVLRLPRSWNSVWMYPGQSAVTCTPVLRSSTASDSEYVITPALIAEYDPS